MNKQQQAREQILKDVLDKHSGENNTMVLLPTGSGKTNISFRLGLSKSNNKKSSLRVWVYDTSNIDGMFKEIEDRGLTDSFKSVEVVSYASSGKDHGEVDIEVFDEIHRGLGEITSKNHIANVNLSKYKIFTTATLSDEEILRIKEIWGGMGDYRMTLDEAIDMELVPPPSIVIINVDPNKVEQTEEVKYGKEVYKVSQQSKLNKFNKDIAYWIDSYKNDRKKPAYMKNKFLQLGSQRLRYMASIKTNIVKELTNIVPSRKIAFCGSVAQAKEIGGSKHTLSSKEKDNAQKLEDFNNKKIDLLTVKQKVKEGTNLVDCQTGIITQIGNQQREVIQMTGRILRHDNPVVIFVVLNDKKDKSLFYQNREAINDKYVVAEYTVKDIFMGEESKSELKDFIDNLYNNVLSK